MHMAPRAAAWVAWAVWTCNTPHQGIRSKDTGLRSALFLCQDCRSIHGGHVTRLTFLLLATLVCGEARAEAHIDGSEQESLNTTLVQMMRELPPRKAAELNTAIASLPFAGMTPVKDTPADGVVKLDLKKFDGMTADQI